MVDEQSVGCQEQAPCMALNNQDTVLRLRNHTLFLLTSETKIVETYKSLILCKIEIFVVFQIFDRLSTHGFMLN